MSTPKHPVRTVESDPEFMLVYFLTRNLEDGKFNFVKVAELMGLPTEDAAKKRYSRLIKKQETTTTTTENTTPTPTSAKTSVKKSGGRKRKHDPKPADANPVDNKHDDEDHFDSDDTPSKKAKILPSIETGD